MAVFRSVLGMTSGFSLAQSNLLMVGNAGLQAPRSPLFAPDFQLFLELSMKLGSLYMIDQEYHTWHECWEPQDLIPKKSLLVVL